MNFRSFAVAAAVLLLPGILPGAAPLAEGGKGTADITVSPAHPQLVYAGEELSKWAGRLTGGEFPVSEKPGGAKTHIILGTPKLSEAVRAAADPEALKRIGETDGFAIMEKGNTVYIYGTRTKGVLNGVYRFLELNSDIIWVRPREAENGFGTIYSVNPDMKNTVENLVDVPDHPVERYWTPHTTESRIHQARLLNTFTGAMSANMNPKLYDELRKVADMDEMEGILSLGLLQPYYDSHPEYFPKSASTGKRVNYHDCQLCFMNPETVKAFCREAAKIVEGYPKKVTRYFIGQGDNSDLCCCELCTAPIELPDGRVVKPSDPNFRSTQYALFVNAVSDFLTFRYPWVKPSVMIAYLFSADAPAVPLRAEGPKYCPYIKNHKKPVFDDSVNRVWHADAEHYKALGFPVRNLYEYYLCSSTPQFYHAVCEVAQKDFLYYGKTLKGIYLDTVGGDRDGMDTGGVYDVSAIEFWVMSRLMWNSRTDVRAARREFCRRAFREAAPVMIEYFEKLAEVYNGDPAGCFWNDDPVSAAKHYILERNLSGFVREHLSAALSAARHPGSKELIRRHQMRMEHLISEAEKRPPVLTLRVPVTPGVPKSLDVLSDEWKDAPEIRLTVPGDPKTPYSGDATIKVRQNKSDLFILCDFRGEKPLALWEKLEARPDHGKGASFDWGACLEMFFDFDLKTAGSYYHLAVELNGRRHTGQGPAPLDNPPAWSADARKYDRGVRILVTLPFSSFGVIPSQNNKIGGMVIVNMPPRSGAWNGGHWHSPTGFQTLQLDLD